NIMMRFMDILLSFPGILLALIMVVMLGPGTYNLMIAVGISAIPRIARLVRSSVLSVKETAFVEAARATGSSDMRIMVRHVLPNILAPLMIYATLRVGTAILSAASLSYLGLGATPPTPEWGLMAAGGRKFLRTSWWLSIFPGISIGLVVVSLNMLGDALRDILDPRFQQ
ncbi:MAG: ABC transporter permease, partial [Clostridia bacterium]